MTIELTTETVINIGLILSTLISIFTLLKDNIAYSYRLLTITLCASSATYILNVANNTSSNLPILYSIGVFSIVLGSCILLKMLVEAG